MARPRPEELQPHSSIFTFVQSRVQFAGHELFGGQGENNKMRRKSSTWANQAAAMRGTG